MGIYGPNPTHALSGEVLAECVNREELCAFWAAIGECEANKAYMKLKCAPSCQTCDMIDIKSRCPPLGDDVRPALLPGELNAMFELILATAPGNQTGDAVHIGEGMTNYSVHVHSRTRPREEDEEPIITRERDLAEPPWIITFEDFLTEDLQMLKYEPGQFYRQHHDYIGHQRDRRSGPRVLTFFLYLSDVEEGGATNFPKLGRALLWPSVLDSNPKDKEPRTDHEAQSVITGTKFAVNAWLHLHDYMAATEMACT